jgi:hypothetical protein
MKNKSLLIASVFAASSVFAQDLTSKKGEPMLPEAGDWAISFDATPFLNYAGQMFSNAGAAAPTATYTNGYPWSIKGKMFKDEKTAYRAGIRLGFGSYTERALVDDASDNAGTPVSYPTEPATVEDSYKASYNGIVLTGGLEMRRGKTRLQGYYGGELLIGFGGNKDTYTYGNALNTNTDATGVSGSNGASWNGGANFTTDSYGNAARYTERKSSSMMIGLRGFIGVEYFVLPKISIGAEYGWGFGMMSTKTTDTYESRGLNASAALQTASFTEENKENGMTIDTDINGDNTAWGAGAGSLNIIFHF